MQGWFGGLFIEPDGAWLSAFSCSRQTRQDVKRTCRASWGFVAPCSRRTLLRRAQKLRQCHSSLLRGLSAGSCRESNKPGCAGVFLLLWAGWFCGFGEMPSFWLAPWVRPEVVRSLRPGTAGELGQGSSEHRPPHPARVRRTVTAAEGTSLAGLVCILRRAAGLCLL